MQQRPSLILALVALVTLAGCAEMRFISAASTAVRTEGTTPLADPASPDLGPRYKVGSPYQIKGTWYYPKEDFSYEEEGIASWYGPNFHGKQTANGAIFDETKISAAHRTLPMPSMVRVTNLENGRSLKVIVNDRGPFAHSRIIDLSRRASQLLGFEVQGTTLVRVELLEAETRDLYAAVTSGQRSYVASAGGARPEPPKPTAAPTATVSGEDLGAPEGTQASSVPTETDGRANVADGSIEREPAAVDKSIGEVTLVPVANPPSVFIQAGAFGDINNAVRARSRLNYLGPVVVEEITRSDVPLYRVRLGPLPDDNELEAKLVAVIAAGFSDARIVVPQ